MVQDALDRVCNGTEGCESLAFVDLSTRMVLVSNADTPESQDTLNLLCAEAARHRFCGIRAGRAGLSRRNQR